MYRREKTEMFEIEFMKPFFAKYSGQKLRLVFAYQYLSIKKDGEIFHFIPIEGKEIIIDAKTRQVNNLSDVFVFQRGNRFVRLALYQLLLVSNVFEHLDPIINSTIPKNALIQDSEVELVKSEEIDALVNYLEKQHLLKEIDNALDQREEERFTQLVAKLNELFPTAAPEILEEQVS